MSETLPVNGVQRDELTKFTEDFIKNMKVIALVIVLKVIVLEVEVEHPELLGSFTQSITIPS